MAPDYSQSELLSLDFNDVAENRDVILTTTDGTNRHQVTTGDCSSGRLLQQNILKEGAEPIPYARRNMVAGSPASAWHLRIDSFILKRITICTITEGHR